jgi:hypothetical protein
VHLARWLPSNAAGGTTMFATSDPVHGVATLPVATSERRAGHDRVTFGGDERAG